MNHVTEASLLPPLLKELAKYRDQPVFFDPLLGNNGDQLIEMGSHELFQELGVKLVNRPQQAEVILVNGGGGMTDTWGFGFDRLQKYNCQYPDIPLVVFPSSFSFTQTDFPSLFRDRSAPAFIYAREWYSLKILQALAFPSKVRLGIDHDMSFWLQSSTYLRHLQAKTAQNHILIVERSDPESVTGSYQPNSSDRQNPARFNPSVLTQKVPRRIRQPLRRHLVTPLKYRIFAKRLSKQGINTAFAQAWLEQIVQDDPTLEALPVFAADISDPKLCNIHQFSNLIAEAAVVVATRLHVGILAAMLGKPTYLKTGSYHKIQGIYEYSLIKHPNVRLI